MPTIDFLQRDSSATRCWRGWLLASVLVCGLCGCGKTARVTGKVSYQGRPVSHGSVIFYSADKAAHSGVIGPDSSYTVEEVPRGGARIAVISRNPSKGRSTLRGQETTGKSDVPKQVGAEAWFPLPRKYETVETSGLGCSVDSRHVVHDIELK